jgi:hypothetical protein
MFITRKVYGAGPAAYVGYVVVDKYGHEAQLTPQEAQSLHQWLADHAAQIHSDVHGETVDDQAETMATINTLLENLPIGYPPARVSKEPTGYKLRIDNTNIFHSASAADAIKHTKNYVEARKTNPDLPIGVIYGNYD